MQVQRCGMILAAFDAAQIHLQRLEPISNAFAALSRCLDRSLVVSWLAIPIPSVSIVARSTVILAPVAFRTVAIELILWLRFTACKTGFHPENLSRSGGHLGGRERSHPLAFWCAWPGSNRHGFPAPSQDAASTEFRHKRVKCFDARKPPLRSLRRRVQSRRTGGSPPTGRRW